MRKTIVMLTLIFLWGLFGTNAPAYEWGKTSIHGFVSQGYLKSDKNNFLAETEDGTFQFNELGINFSAELTEKLRLGIQFFARDMGEIGNDDIIIDWAFADYRWKDWLGLRVGKVKIPLGFYNETRDIDMVRTSILLPQSVYLDIHRDNVIALQGVGTYGDILLGVMGNLSYQFQYGTMNVDKESGSAKVVEKSFGLVDVKEFDFDELMTASLKWETPLEGLHVGASMLKADVDIHATTTAPLGYLPAGTPLTVETSDYTAEILSAEYSWRNLTVSAEYAVTSTESRMTSQSVVIFPENKIESEGYYGGISYRFTDWFELGMYYSEYYPNKDGKDGKNTLPDHSAWSKDTALTTRFDINPNWTLKLEGHSIDGTALLFQADNPEGTDKGWFLFAAKMTFSF